MKLNLIRITLFSLVALLVSVSVQSQNDSRQARLSGRFTDASGSGVGEVKIVAYPLSAASTAVFSTSSSPDGTYSFPVPPGRYEIQVQHPSFVSRNFTIELASGETHSLDLHLEIAPMSQNVVVTANAQPVSADRTAAPVDLISQEEIVQRQAVSLPDLLATQTGVSLARTGTVGGLASIFIDGGNSNFTKVLVDGTPVNEPGGALNLSNLTLDNVDKVEIVHGAESALYGTDAMSGVIQIVSHRGTTRIPAVSLFAEGGNFSSARGGGQFSGLLGALDYSAAASYASTDGQGVDGAFLNRSFAGNFGYRFSDSNQLRLTVRNNSSFAGTPGQTLFASALPFAVDTTAYDNLKQFSGNLTWSFTTGSHWTHRIAGMESRILDTNAFPDFSFFAADQFNRSGFLGQSTYFYRQVAATAGYQYEVENAYPSSLGGTHARRNNQAGFVDLRWQAFPRLSLNAGLRIEANTNFGTRGVPRLGAVYALRHGRGFWGDTRAKISYGQGIEEPTVFESFSIDPCNPGNPSLRPERSRTFNTGIDQYLSAERFRISATYFTSEFRDLINQTVGQANSSCFTGNEMLLFNTDLSRARGMNWSGEAHLNRWLSLKGNYSFDDTRVLKTVEMAPVVEQPGNHLLRRPVNSGNLWINANYRRLNFNVAGYFSGRRTDSDFLGLGITRNPGYARFDIATSYDLPRGVSFYGRVSNLFDKQYQEAIGYPALGRDFRLGLNYRFSGRN
jgi:vitamin B12 transporter